MLILRASMLRRLLACLVLLTGLAAVAAPGSASIVEEVACEAGVTTDVEQADVSVYAPCRDPGDEARREPEKSSAPTKRSRPVNRPPVLFGIDRAYE